MSCLLCRTGLGMLKKKQTYDPTAVRCFKCHISYDKIIAGLEVGGSCPRCDHELKPDPSGFIYVCIKCEEPY